MEVHEPSSFTRTTSCPSQPRDKARTVSQDIMGTGGLTRNGRCYASGPSRVKKGEVGIEQSDVEVTILKKKGKKPLNEPISETEANEFLSIENTTLSSNYINYQLRFSCYH